METRRSYVSFQTFSRLIRLVHQYISFLGRKDARVASKSQSSNNETFSVSSHCFFLILVTIVRCAIQCLHQSDLYEVRCILLCILGRKDARVAAKPQSSNNKTSSVSSHYFFLILVTIVRCAIQYLHQSDLYCRFDVYYSAFYWPVQLFT
jgi:hypothetical protein